MYLLDTNIWLEVLLDQERAESATRLLAVTPPGELHMTDFTLHSIGVILTRLKRLATLHAFVADLHAPPAVSLVRLDLQQTALLPAISQRFKLDFDDAYQYAAAQVEGLQLVSFDADFDRTDLVRKTPAQVVG